MHMYTDACPVLTITLGRKAVGADRMILAVTDKVPALAAGSGGVSHGISAVLTDKVAAGIYVHAGAHVLAASGAGSLPAGGQ